MDWQRSDDSAERYSAYLDGLANVFGHAARVGPLRDYCTGLLLPCERKSVEPIAAATAPGETSARNRSLLHFLAKGEWSADKVGLGRPEGVISSTIANPPVTQLPSARGIVGLRAVTMIAQNLVHRDRANPTYDAPKRARE